MLILKLNKQKLHIQQFYDFTRKRVCKTLEFKKFFYLKKINNFLNILTKRLNI